MTQTATVTALSGGDGRVELTIARQTACGHGCESCGRCGGEKLVVRAASDVPVDVGDQVEVYSDSRVLGFAAVVYLGPVALFLLGYLLPASLPEPWRYLCGGAGFVLGLAAAVACDRLVQRKRAPAYRVVRKL